MEAQKNPIEMGKRPNFPEEIGEKILKSILSACMKTFREKKSQEKFPFLPIIGIQMFANPRRGSQHPAPQPHCLEQNEQRI